ncbi:MAG TPA: VCBS repeat-containing protein [Cyclobacteriaceae bacterium]|nr:VCBS repeat-containing protein [Cyclobacteriaceae bacterium]
MIKPLNCTVVFSLVCLFISTQCSHSSKDTLFISLPSSATGIDFVNSLAYDDEFNIYTYRNFYNGGGVALGDINNDGLLDIYFTSNQKINRLYLNKGNFQFEDITEKAGVGGTHTWSTGVSMADVNGDGWLDIYVCNSGGVKGDNRQNELFINNGNLTFAEKGQEFGVDNTGLTTHAAFFDYDHDGDLDLYILNNSYVSVGEFNLMKVERPRRDPHGGDKLLRNDNGKFVDVSAEAGIYGSIIGFGLGVTVGDVNKDGWLDVYVSNDFFERDYLYINQRNGTFKEQLTRSIKSISMSSMGADLADINNDTWPDIFVTDMLPATNDRIKSVTTFQNWDIYKYNVENGYHHQFVRNCFQLNDGDTTFSEIGRLLGVQATDWSWGALMFDMNNDGRRDIFVANGIYKDLTNQDYLQYIANTEVVKTFFTQEDIDYQQMIEAIPSNKIPNSAFQNMGNLTFVDRAKEWGLGMPSFSNGSAYGDFDNDGDLDLIVNNVNMPAFVLKNRANEMTKNNFLKFILRGEGRNTNAIGASITINADSLQLFGEQMPMRGFQSSVDPRPNFGLGSIDVVDKVVVVWPSGKITELKDVRANQTLVLNEAEASVNQLKDGNDKIDPMLKDVSHTIGIDYRHKENEFVDFDHDHLIFHMLSTEGPHIAKGDVNGDGLEDFYIGGAKDSEGAMYIQNGRGGFQRINQQTFEKDKVFEDTDCVFLDVEHDGDLDLYVCSGGNEFDAESRQLQDRLYINDGLGNFSKGEGRLPDVVTAVTSCVVPADYDRDGDLDLFIGTRVKPRFYGMPVNGFILNNDGTGHFTDVTGEIAPGLHHIGLITSATWSDIDGDKDSDLVVVGEWMPITIFKQDNGKFANVTATSGLDKSNGLWNRIAGADVDHDGDIDFVVGNHGLNSKLKSSVEKPLQMYTGDFDESGDVEQIICMYYGDTSYPLVLRHDLVKQLQGLKKKYLRYEDYKNETIGDIFSNDQLRKATQSDVYQLQTSILINDGKGNFKIRALPIEAQFSPVFGILLQDLDTDGNVDIFLGGNLYGAKPEIGRYDASHGQLFSGNGRGDFKYIPQNQSGLKIDGEVRDIVSIDLNGRPFLLVARNNNTLLIFQVNTPLPILQ